MVILKYIKKCFQIKLKKKVRKLLLDSIPLGEGCRGIDSDTYIILL